jgi:hypothetical protein
MKRLGKGNFDYARFITLRRRVQEMGYENMKRLIDIIKSDGYEAVLIDPLYRLIAGQNIADRKARNENDNIQMAEFFLQLDEITEKTKAAISSVHYFTKGSAKSKSPMDRFSGAGSFNRDPDTIIMLTDHKEKDAYVVDFGQRNFETPSVCIRFSFPIFELAPDLDPADLKTGPQASTQRESKTAPISVTAALEYLRPEGSIRSVWKRDVVVSGIMSDSTFNRKFREATKRKLVELRSGKYHLTETGRELLTRVKS